MGTIRRKSNMKLYECFTQGNAEEQGISQGVLTLEMPYSKVITLHLKISKISDNGFIIFAWDFSIYKIVNELVPIFHNHDEPTFIHRWS